MNSIVNSDNRNRYKKVYKPDHPRAMSCGCVYEHRLVMESLIGRYLEPEEQVHHVDEDKTNNSPSNLKLCSTQKEHSLEHSYSDEFLIDMLVRFADIRGHLPSKKECDRDSQMPHSSTYIRRFGTWSTAKAIASTRLHIFNVESYNEYSMFC